VRLQLLLETRGGRREELDVQVCCACLPVPSCSLEDRTGSCTVYRCVPDFSIRGPYSVLPSDTVRSTPVLRGVVFAFSE
jgi:hypothetical protein